MRVLSLILTKKSLFFIIICARMTGKLYDSHSHRHPTAAYRQVLLVVRGATQCVRPGSGGPPRGTVNLASCRPRGPRQTPLRDERRRFFPAAGLRGLRTADRARNSRTRTHFASLTSPSCLTMSANSGLREAPPTRKPSMSGHLASSPQFFALAEPLCWMRVSSATSLLTRFVR